MRENPSVHQSINQSNPIQSNPIQSNPIQSNPIQSNPIHQSINQSINVNQTIGENIDSHGDDDDGDDDGDDDDDGGDDDDDGDDDGGDGGDDDDDGDDAGGGGGGGGGGSDHRESSWIIVNHRETSWNVVNHRESSWIIVNHRAAIIVIMVIMVIVVIMVIMVIILLLSFFHQVVSASSPSQNSVTLTCDDSTPESVSVFCYIPIFPSGFLMAPPWLETNSFPVWIPVGEIAQISHSNVSGLKQERVMKNSMVKSHLLTHNIHGMYIYIYSTVYTCVCVSMIFQSILPSGNLT